MTAVEFIESKIHLYYTLVEKPYTKSDLVADLELAKKMHKKEVKDAYNQGYRDGLIDGSFTIKAEFDISECSNAENYYNKIFFKHK